LPNLDVPTDHVDGAGRAAEDDFDLAHSAEADEIPLPAHAVLVADRRQCREEASATDRGDGELEGSLLGG
jgi:hypothetical protein